jgi:glycosyltransferase involved in cell wall biosynthesis
LDEALDSIAAQTETDLELVIVGNGAPPALRERLQARAQRDPRVRLIWQERPGLTAALNRGLEDARGKYVARQDSDDWSAPGRLAAQRRFLESSGADLVSSHCRVIDERGRLIGVKTPPDDSELLRRTLEHHNCLAHSALFARRAALEALGGYRPEFVYTQDYDLYLRALTSDLSLRVLSEVLLDVRMTPDNITTARRREQLGFALAAQADYFARRGVARPAAWLKMRHHLVRYCTPDLLRRAKRRVLEALR